jgi:hypothetical protein
MFPHLVQHKSFTCGYLWARHQSFRRHSPRQRRHPLPGVALTGRRCSSLMAQRVKPNTVVTSRKL